MRRKVVLFGRRGTCPLRVPGTCKEIWGGDSRSSRAALVGASGIREEDAHAPRSSGSSGRDSLDGVGLLTVSSVRVELAGDGAGLGGLSVREIVPMTRAPPAWAAMRSAMRVPSALVDGRARGEPSRALDARGSGSGGTSAGAGSRLSSGLTCVRPTSDAGVTTR